MKALKNWKLVYSFTCKQYMGTARFKIITAIIGLVLIAALMIPIILINQPEDEIPEDEILRTVYVLNKTDASMDKLSQQFKQAEALADVELVLVKDKSDDDFVAYIAGETKQGAGIIFQKEEDKYLLRGVIPDNSNLDGDALEAREDSLKNAFYGVLLLESKVEPAQLVLIQMPVTANSVKVGEDTGIAVYLIKFLAPLVFGLFMYFIVLLYGQSVCKEVSVEKTSKLMETLLTSIHPYALITGKVLAIFSTAMLQCLIWVGCIVAAIFGGSIISDKLYPNEANVVATAVKFLRDEIGKTAFSVPSLIMALVVFFAGSLLFLALAGVAGSIISKPEDTANAQTIFIWPILISWLVPYFATMAGNENVMRICRVVPFTAPFCVPAELLTGVVNWGVGILSTVLVLVMSALIIWVTARIYRGLVLYTGQKVKLKNIVGVIRGR